MHTTTATSYAFYDGFGNPLTSIDADGRSIDYTFNGVNQETGEAWSDQIGSDAGSVNYSYNYTGEMTDAKNVNVRRNASWR